MKNLLAGDTVAYKVSISGTYHVSITSGFYCIDNCKFFVPYGEMDFKPTSQGIALPLREWTQMRNIIDAVYNTVTYPSPSIE